MVDSDLITQADTDQEQVDVDCPECGSSNVLRSTTFSIAELDGKISPWCEDCGYGWVTVV